MSRNRPRSGRRSGHPPEGENWIWHTLASLDSPAWRSRSIHCRRLIDFLEIEHLRHGGADNGSLLATYNQLEAFGIGRRFIFGAIREAEQRGPVVVECGGRKGVVLNELKRDAEALTAWQDITPLARNEWICWVTSAKKAETREKRIRWGCESLSEGKCRPRC